MSLWELILCLHCDFLAALFLQEKHTKRWGGLYKRRMTSHEFQKSSQKKMVWRQRCIMSKDVHPSCRLAYCQQMWWILRVDVVSECNETGEIHEGHWYRAATFNSESPHAGHSENILDANEFVLVTFLYLSLEEPLGAEYWAMSSFGLMQLLLFAPLPAEKSLDQMTSQKPPQKMLRTDTWCSSRLPRLSLHSGKHHSYTALF